MTSYPGGDTLGIVTKTPTGQTDSMGENITADSVVWVYGCVFDIYSRGPIEEQSDTVTSEERAWAFLPYVPGVGIPAVDENGNQVVATINNANWIRPKRPDALAQRDYKVMGLPELEYDMDGAADHVWIVCEWRAG
ncbi:MULTISPECIES: hypothetical protein [Mycobacterium]|uniref:Uncharacterized protein n=2 Tax=Mycobacterium TaxID=1763 RepID=A0A2G5PQQ2_MYCCE|nr:MULTISPECIES: hypothetical protein [Mycobacterium]MCV7232766.1 hypothetical protein [Mycobacterium branderi]ORA40904.1 hypothetical protein BST20_01785 [Mycobacterium branderi]PIB80560.1 hypothetical protein CQY23_03195 [Mycobacterium celatum]BBZ09864.1 hypothetical protein MBRA_00590 [Mycobacterium branderi]